MSAKPPARGLARHFEGWQPALLSVFFAGSAAIIAVPRPVDPTFLPVPLADPRAITRSIAAEDKLARAAERDDLDLDVRKLGSAIRAYGVTESEGDEVGLLKARPQLASAAASALAQGEEGVLRLRAYQLRLFLAEVRRWEATGEETQELRELGGTFLRMLSWSGWSTSAATRGAGGRERRVLMDEPALRTAWKRRWNDVTGIHRPSFEPTLDEQRFFYRFVLTHPIGRPDQSLLPADARAYEDQYRLKKIRELGAVDPAYPKDLASGIVLYRLGRYMQATEALRRHLEASPDGAFTLRARSYLRAALSRAREKEAIGADSDGADDP